MRLIISRCTFHLFWAPCSHGCRGLVSARFQKLVSESMLSKRAGARVLDADAGIVLLLLCNGGHFQMA